MTSEEPRAQDLEEDAVATRLRQVGHHVLHGDFAAARDELERDRKDSAPDAAERLTAARFSLRLDPAALVVVLLCGAAILAIAVLTLIHNGN